MIKKLNNLERKKVYINLLKDIEKDYHGLYDDFGLNNSYYICNKLKLFLLKNNMNCIKDCLNILNVFPELRFFKPTNLTVQHGWWNEINGNDCRKIALGFMIAMCDENL